jgi:asparagine synthetase B (glutamine-hydrolysing)
MSEPEVIAAKNISIRGLPVFSGEVLSPASPVFTSLSTLPDFVRFAKQLRGQFSIIVEDGARTIAITDFGCSRPVFYLRDSASASYRVSVRLPDLIPFSRKQLRKEALFFYSSRSGVGISPFYSDIEGVFPATVACFEGPRFESLRYLEWGEFLEVRPIAPADAERRFIEIASDYLGAIARSRGQIGCLLSGGTDSALIAWLLQRIGQDGLSMTADFAWKRYSEFTAAADSARALGVPHQKVLVTAASRREAFFALNSKSANAPCCNSQAILMYELARHALERGVATLATGDHADSLFLGFDRFFRGFPNDAADFSRAIGSMDGSGKLSRALPKPGVSQQPDRLIWAMGASDEEWIAWNEKIYSRDYEAMSKWADAAPLDALLQLDGQIWAGIGWQNIFLPATLAFDDRLEFVSPFYDIEMIRFALSLPVEYKFRNGVTKPLLRDILRRILGHSIVSRASPNPSRVWRLAPDFRERSLQPPRLRSLYDWLFRRNLLSCGKGWGELDKVAALGVWLSQQPIER